MKTILVSFAKTSLSVSTFVVSMCAVGQDLRSTAAARQACGPAEIRFSKEAGLEPHPLLSKISAGKALLYLIQIQGTPDIGPLTFADRGPITKFGVDGHWQGATWGNSFVSTELNPGDHHLCVAWNDGGPKKLEQVIALQSLHAEADKTYVYGVRLVISGVSFSFEFSLLDADEAAMLLNSYPLSKLKQRP